MRRERLSMNAIQDRLNGLNAGTGSPWAVQGNAIGKSFEFADFAAAFGFMTKVAELAERLDHHPDWCNSYNRVEIRLTTHSSGVLTELDFALAEAIEAVARC